MTLVLVHKNLSDKVAVQMFALEVMPRARFWHAVAFATGSLVMLWGRLVETGFTGPGVPDDKTLEFCAGWGGKRGVYAKAFHRHFVVDGECVLWADRRWAWLRVERDRRPDIPADVRRAVRGRDADRCVWCGSDHGLELDHIVEWSKGGEHSVDNLRLLCWPCHRKRHGYRSTDG